MLKLNLEGLINWGKTKKVTGSFFTDDRVLAKKVRIENGIVTDIYGDIKEDDVFTINKPEEYEIS